MPYDFVVWLRNEGPNYYARLNNAYSNDGNSYGNSFNSGWKAIAVENPGQFLYIQHQFVKAEYYEKTV